LILNKEADRSFLYLPIDIHVYLYVQWRAWTSKQCFKQFNPKSKQIGLLNHPLQVI